MPAGFASLEQARAHVAGIRQALAERSLALREPPPEPTTCCGRGCNGCVWEGYEAALGCWLQDAQGLLAR